MYLNHFSLARLPFDFLLDPDLTYWSPGLKTLWVEVTQRLGNGHSPQFVVGRAGCGKSLFLHLLALHSIDQGHNCAYIDAASQRADLFESLSQAYGLEYPSQNEEQYLTWFESFLASSRLGGIQNVLLLDNVHRMDPQTLQKLVYLVKIRIDNTPLLHVVATVAEEEDREALELLAANQISVEPRSLPPLDVKQTGAYIAHRLKAAGHDSGDLFDEDVVEWIHTRSRGIPREINYYADLFMTHAYLRHQRRIHARLIQLVDPTDSTRKAKETRANVVEKPVRDKPAEKKTKTSPRPPQLTADSGAGKAAEQDTIKPTGPADSDKARATVESRQKADSPPPDKTASTESQPSGQDKKPAAAKRTEAKTGERGSETGKETTAAGDARKAPPPPSTGEQSSSPKDGDESPAASRRGLFLAAAALVMVVLAGLALLQIDDAGEVAPARQTAAVEVGGEGANAPIPVTRTPPAQPVRPAEADGKPPVQVAQRNTAPKPEAPAKAEAKPAPRSEKPAQEKAASAGTPARSENPKPKVEEQKKPAKTLVAKAEPPSEPTPAAPAATETAPPPAPQPAETVEDKANSTPPQPAPEANAETELQTAEPTPQEDGSEFASFTPAPSGQDTLMAVQALDNLVHRFQWAYENADEHVLAEIFDPNIRTNENSGRETILKEYGQFFRVTQSRRLAIGPIEWQTSGAVSTGVGRFTAYVVTKRGKERTFTGTLTIETIATPKGPKITALYYRYDS